MSDTPAFIRAYEVVRGTEGGYSGTPEDPGNWTGGECGVGELRGTKFGISAAAYPTIQIRSLDLDSARAIYKRDYWDRIRGDELPAALAMTVFDAAVNNGVHKATTLLQQSLGVAADGVIGPHTLEAINLAWARGGAVLLARFNGKRTWFMSRLPTWATFGEGWCERLSRLPFQSVAMAQGAVS